MAQQEGMFTGLNALYLEEMAQRFQQDPSTVDRSWQAFFQNEGRELLGEEVTTRGPSFKARSIFASGAQPMTAAASSERSLEMLTAQMKIAQLINSYRRHGHLKAHLDPLGIRLRSAHPTLDPAYWGLGEAHMDRRFATSTLHTEAMSMTLRELIAFLEETYARTIGAEYMHLTNFNEIEWLQEQCERTRNHRQLDQETRRFILERLCAAEAFEKFLEIKFLGAKRFSLQGAESLVPLLALLIENGARGGVNEVVLGMPHRGRLNVLANIFQKGSDEIFSEFEDMSPEDYLGRGDVKYHMGYSQDMRTRHGDPVHLSLAFNPSHLEAINPIVSGRVRAKQDRLAREARASVMPVLIHGDAAFPGQGLVAETLNLMSLRGYSVGGTIHVIVNNQLGFTTDPIDARSSTYCTDIAKMIEVPIFHVNGEDPEAVAHVAMIASEYRLRFGKDLIIDMYGFRRYGHNETDEPKFTQPRMYEVIGEHPPVGEVYARTLVERKHNGFDPQAELEGILERERERLDASLTELRAASRPPLSSGATSMQGRWSSYIGGPDESAPEADTSITSEQFDAVARAQATFPETFAVHRKLLRIFEQRAQSVDGASPIDWGMGEALAYGSLLMEGHPVRISGQDCQRGTFSHRHVVLNDQNDGSTYTPLAKLATGSARFEVFNSPLSEAAVLGFECGYSMDMPEALVIWEAQFGDFANGAQVIIDQFISSCEDKWERLTGVTMLLPHGYEGQGPEHSSARLERFLQLCAEDNMQVCNLTTPAQIFHALRRQVVRSWRKPLVVMTPKSLLRLPQAVSTKGDFTERGFQRVIDDPDVEDASSVRRVVLCSGKVYYDLAAHREELEETTTALVRVEQLYPFPEALIERVIARYAGAEEVVWCQEEPRNMGAFSFIYPQLTERFGGELRLRWVTRLASASPATGSPRAHKMEQADLMRRVFQTDEAVG